jgi:hypothetical protein
VTHYALILTSSEGEASPWRGLRESEIEKRVASDLFGWSESKLQQLVEQETDFVQQLIGEHMRGADILTFTLESLINMSHRFGQFYPHEKKARSMKAAPKGGWLGKKK